MPAERPIITWSEPGWPLVGKDFACELAETALHAVADDRAADLLADGESDSLGGVAVLTVADEQDEAGHRRAPTGVRSEKVRAFPEDC